MNKNHTINGAFVINASNADEALATALSLIKQLGVPVTSRGLGTLEMPGPVMTLYTEPQRRIVFDDTRDANPFFHFFESLWILSGSNTVDMPAFFLPRIKDYSDDGRTFHGAYGYRLRAWPSDEDKTFDQITSVINLLRRNPDTRQAVVSIWNPMLDLGTKTKDMPCNDMIMFKIRHGALNMTVCNRSNDAIWGAYGANVVQFSMIQEYVAAMCGIRCGQYVQMSDSLHVYTDNDKWKLFDSGDWKPMGSPKQWASPYMHGTKPVDLFSDLESDSTATHQFAEVAKLFELGRQDLLLQPGYLKSFVFRDVVRPMLGAYMAYKAGDWAGAEKWLDAIRAPDWQLACRNWIWRRAHRAVAAAV